MDICAIRCLIIEIRWCIIEFVSYVNWMWKFGWGNVGMIRDEDHTLKLSFSGKYTSDN